MESVPCQDHNRAGLPVTSSVSSRYRGEEGGQASIYSSRTRSPVCGVFGHPPLCRLAHPASSHAISSEERLMWKGRLLANPSSLFWPLPVPHCYTEPTCDSC